MTDDELPRFEEGEQIGVRGHTYEVRSVDVRPIGDDVIQYRLDAVDGGPAATLRPAEGDFTIAEYHAVEADEIERTTK